LALSEVTGPKAFYVFVAGGFLGTAVILVLRGSRGKDYRTAIVAAGLFAALVASNGLWMLREHSRSSRMQRLASELEGLLADQKPLPQVLADAPLGHLESVFGLDSIRYQRKEGQFTLESYQIPNGPFESYSSHQKAWSHYE
jgi:hypothetical protein